jgi:hypothetical protein
VRVVTETAVRLALAFDARQSQKEGAMARHMAWSTYGDLLLLAHDEHRPTDDEWRSWLRAYETRSPRIRGVLVRSLGGGPSSSQRKELVEAMEAQTIRTPTAILTSSAIARGVLTALSWFLSAERLPRTFTLDDVVAALTFLGVDAASEGGVRAELARLAGSLDLPARRAAGGA